MKVAEYATNTTRAVIWVMKPVRREDQDCEASLLPTESLVIYF
jgi:hypothetical protein